MWKQKNYDLSTEDVLKVLDNLANSSILVVSIEGGDPLMRKDLGKILQYASQKDFYLFVTTNGHLLDKKPIEEYAKYIDFLHISIDEGHENLDFFDRLAEFQQYGVPICVQIVVTKDTLSAIEDKVKKVYAVNARTVIMPAVYLPPYTENVYPEPKKFMQIISALKKKYRNTITTSNGFLRNINRLHGCSASSIIIDSDGGLFYPCRMLRDKPYNLTSGSLMSFLKSRLAEKCRLKMRSCNARCGWYQYFATDTFTAISSFIPSLYPYLKEWVGSIKTSQTC
jgi:MoaA/NifB/PqqE/SkfB family radical SAM enzyme